MQIISEIVVWKEQEAKVMALVGVSAKANPTEALAALDCYLDTWVMTKPIDLAALRLVRFIRNNLAFAMGLPARNPYNEKTPGVSGRLSEPIPA